MRTHWVDYRAQESDPQRWNVLNRGFWIHDIPRPLLLCRALCHKAVVDGTGKPGEPGYLSRWVVCDRCGVRPEPQGNLDASKWDVGARYTGEWAASPTFPNEALKSLRDRGEVPPMPQFTPPGPWPTQPTWTFGGQAILGKSSSGVSGEVKVGNAGSEQPLAAHLRVNPIGALYLHTEDLGRGIQRRLNPTGYESRTIGVDVSLRRLTWKLWAKRNSWSKKDPRWLQGSLSLDPMAKLLGPKRWWHTDVAGPVDIIVRLPHGDDHTVEAKLQRADLGRPKLRHRETSWTVDWDCKPGIPTKPGDHGRIQSAAVEISAASVREGTWMQEASAAIAQQITGYRARNGMHAAEVA